DEHLQRAPFLLGRRPSSADFALFGQLSQLVQFDPTPTAAAAELAPRVVAWVNQLDDLGWLADPRADDWTPRAALGGALRPLLREIGRVYAPFLLANAAALASGAKEVRCRIDGAEWTQAPFPYQGKCLRWLRDQHAALATSDRIVVDSALADAGC